MLGIVFGKIHYGTSKALARRASHVRTLPPTTHKYLIMLCLPLGRGAKGLRGKRRGGRVREKALRSWFSAECVDIWGV
jgi:hypothetical protein